jgi:hypothetical protein
LPECFAGEAFSEWRNRRAERQAADKHKAEISHQENIYLAREVLDDPNRDETLKIWARSILTAHGEQASA